MPLPHHSRRSTPAYGWRTAQPVRRKRPNWRWLKWFLGIIGALGLAGLIGVLALTLWLAKNLPDPDRLIQREIPLSTKIFDRTGQTVLYEVHGDQRRSLVKLADIPEYLKWATIVAEDREFYQHRGFRLRSMVRAAVANLFAGNRAQGGSTLTQQLVKNAILTTEKTYTRKIKEVLLAYQIERRFTKDEILQLYFNEIPYGSNAYGVAAAADTYFGKQVTELTVSEAAILAAILNKPSRLSPYGGHRDELIARQHYILDTMVETGYLTAAQAEAAKAETLNFRQLAQTITAPHFVFYIKDLLSARYGESAVESGGLQVITTLDLEKQKLAEEIIVDNTKKIGTYGATNTAMLAMDATNGQILAMVGSRDFSNEAIDGQVNVVTSPRQPGSSFKPIVYAAAFRKGYTPDTVLYDVVTPFKNYDGTTYEPKNYTLKEYGPVTMRQALAGSLNIPAVQTIYLAGINDVITLAEELGYTTLKPRSRFGLSLVLGGGEVTLLEHVGAFATFAREGERNPPAAILKVTDRDGQVLEEFHANPMKVLETQVARQVSSVLSDNGARTFIFGSSSALTLPDRPVAAKTGTTNDNKDAWTLGYTPSLAVGVWVGNSNGKEMKSGADGSVVAAPIWQSFMKQALAGTPVETFTPPDPAVTGKPVLDGTLKDGLKVTVDRASGKLATDRTPSTFREERTFLVPHSILYYVNPADPRGPVPAEDQRDPEYAAWEEAVQRWARDRKLTVQEPPTEFDDLHVPANTPSIRWINPAEGNVLTDRQLRLQVWTAAPRGVSRVEYRLNNTILGVSRQDPFNLDLFLDNPTLINGFATLSATAYDNIDNAETAALTVTLQLPALEAGIGWLAPSDGTAIAAANFPTSLQLQLARPENVRQVDLYATGPDGATLFINSIRQIHPTIATPWVRPPATGTYQLYAQVTNNDGFHYRSPVISVTVQ
ncbi:MAG: PBP1A family penicillin-binding protein [Patescibacteria group bacterium]|nr:PBP1A family penicillin-binding protein [Patescibacteria group bacterium]